jgi:hypothetical protein
VTRPRAALAAAIVAVGLGALLVVLSDGDDAAGGALASERQRHASALEAHTGAAILWGNFVVHARKAPVELRSVELVDASPGLSIRRALVADGDRPEARVLVFEAREFERLPRYSAWRKSLHSLAGYTVKPGARDDELVLELDGLRRGRHRVTGGVRLHYSVDGGDASIVLPNQLLVCAPTPCDPPRPKGF